MRGRSSDDLVIGTHLGMGKTLSYYALILQKCSVNVIFLFFFLPVPQFLYLIYFHHVVHMIKDYLDLGV